MGSATPPSSRPTGGSPAELVAALLRSEDGAWPEGADEGAVLAACAAQEAGPLVANTLRRRPGFAGWPARVRETFIREAQDAAARELLIREELVRVLTGLGEAGFLPILFKGTPLAYAVYDAPSLRPRCDTDLLVRPADAEAVRRVLGALGYTSPPYSGGEQLFRQFPLARRDHHGLEHALDVHAEISAAKLFAGLLTYDELAATAEPVPALGPYARAPGAPHALLLACMHPVMHHRNEERLVWIYDIHLLAGRMDAHALLEWADLAARKRLRAVCAHGLALAGRYFGTIVPERVTAALTRSGFEEPSAAYLDPSRHWLDEVGSDLRELRTWQDRLRLLREIAFPRARYMLESYGLGDAWFGKAALPALYLHRGIRGVWRVVRGRK